MGQMDEENPMQPDNPLFPGKWLLGWCVCVFVTEYVFCEEYGIVSCALLFTIAAISM